MKECISLLGPGALEDLGPSLQHLYNKKPADMELADFFEVTKAFANWPFRPQILHDFYAESEYSVLTTDAKGPDGGRV